MCPSSATHLLDINLDVLLQVVAVQIEHQVMDKVKAVAHNDERQLVRQFGLLQEVLHTLRVVAVGLTAYSLHLTNTQKD